MGVDVYEALDYCDAQVQRTLTELKAAEGTIDYSMMPRNIMDSLNTWHCRKATKDEWCSGFWPGVLWYDFEYTGKATIKIRKPRSWSYAGICDRNFNGSVNFFASSFMVALPVYS